MYFVLCLCWIIYKFDILFTYEACAILNTVVDTETVDRENAEDPDDLLLREVPGEPPGDPDEVRQPLVSPHPGLCLLLLVVH